MNLVDVRTKAESFIGLGIFTIFFGLLFPALQKIREAQDRITCACNLRQINTAAHNHAVGNNHKFPKGLVVHREGKPLVDMKERGNPKLGLPNALGDKSGLQFGPNWAVTLLPYMGRDELYREAQVNQFESIQFNYWREDYTRDPEKPPLRAQLLSGLQCPTDRGKRVPYGITSSGISTDPALVAKGDIHGWARGNYVGNAGPDKWELTFRGKSTTRGAGYFGIEHGANLDKIENMDGNSNTIAFTEILTGLNHLDPRGVWALGYPGASLIGFNALSQTDATADPPKTSPTDGRLTFLPNDYGDEVDMFPSCSAAQPEGAEDNRPSIPARYREWGPRNRMGCTDYLEYKGSSPSLPRYGRAQARSHHAGGINVCFGDGVVKFIRNGIKPYIWRWMLSANDGPGPYITLVWPLE